MLSQPTPKIAIFVGLAGVVGCGMTLATLGALAITGQSFHSMDIGMILIFAVAPLYVGSAFCCLFGFLLNIGFVVGVRARIAHWLLLAVPFITVAIGYALLLGVNGHHQGVFRPHNRSTRQLVLAAVTVKTHEEVPAGHS